jgi:hypothetical protein
MSAGGASIKTPTIIIRLAGRSMRSQVVSTGSMSSLRAIVIVLIRFSADCAAVYRATIALDQHSVRQSGAWYCHE